MNFILFLFLAVVWVTAHPTTDAATSSSTSNTSNLTALGEPNPTNRPRPRKRRVWQPRVGTRYQMILSGLVTINASHPSVKPDVPVFDIDLFDTPAEVIAQLHRLRKKVICYFSAGTFEDWRPDVGNFSQDLLGAPLPLWHGEWYLDVRKQKTVEAMKWRIELARQKGCDGVDPDNVDSYSNENGGGFPVPLTAEDLITYYRKLATASHDLSLAIGLKNAPEILPAVSNISQYAVNEECALDQSCTVYENFTGEHDPGWGRFRRGKPVFHVEYVNFTESRENPKGREPLNITNIAFPDLKPEELRRTLCLENGTRWGVPSLAEKLRLSTLIKKLSLDGWLMECDGRVIVTETTTPPDAAGDATNQSAAILAVDESDGALVADVENEVQDDYVDIDLDEELANMRADPASAYPTSTRRGSAKDRIPGPRIQRTSKNIEH